MSEIYDCIVIGVGGFGSGAFYHLAKRGVKVLGIEQFGIGHDRGSSHGESRIIRKAYFEHPDYVPLAIKAYDLWRTLESECGEELMRLTGVLLAGPEKGEAVGGAKLSATQHGLTLEEFSPQEAQVRFPGMCFTDDFSVVHEPDAGFLFVEQSVRMHIQQAREHGGVLKMYEAVRHWESRGNTVVVQTDQNRYEAAKLIITAGPWMVEMLKELALPLRILRKPVFWFPALRDTEDKIAKLPAFLFELPNGVFYGLPGTIRPNLKVAEHSGGKVIDLAGDVDRAVCPEDLKRVEQFIDQCLPMVRSPFERHNVCYYTMTPDGHFIVDRHPHFENVILGAGFSGHGFKFTGVLGQALADLALHGTSSLPVDFLSLSRETLKSKNGRVRFPDDVSIIE